MTSIFTLSSDKEELLASKLIALELLTKESQMDRGLNLKIKTFLKNNFQNMFAMMDAE